jgi:ADP-ribose pyrophosphatase YjhB (NUDIX family)
MKPQFCPYCAAPLKSKTDTQYICKSGHDYWNNPKAASTVILIKDDQALFSQRGIQPNKGKYDFPGGFLEYGESALDATKRELQEETGLIAEELVLIDSSIQDYVPYTTVCDLIYICRSWSGTMQAADDVASLEWKPFDFIDSPQFAWKYPGLVTKLEQL